MTRWPSSSSFIVYSTQNLTEKQTVLQFYSSGSHLSASCRHFQLCHGFILIRENMTSYLYAFSENWERQDLSQARLQTCWLVLVNSDIVCFIKLLNFRKGDVCFQPHITTLRTVSFGIWHNLMPFTYIVNNSYINTLKKYLEFTHGFEGIAWWNGWVWVICFLIFSSSFIQLVVYTSIFISLLLNVSGTNFLTIYHEAGQIILLYHLRW